MTPTNYHIRLLRRFVSGDCPPVDSRTFEELCNLEGMPNALQRESAHGADTSGGFILTALHGLNGSDVDDVRTWLKDQGY